MNNKFIIGISGLATSGKDTLGAILESRLKNFGWSVGRFALANSLKDNIRERLIADYGVDVLNCSAEEKELIRDELVAFGKEKREETLGRYWVSILDEEIKNCDIDLAIVTDIRYKQYDFDEVDWVKSSGVLIHVSRFHYDFFGKKVFVSAPNKDEEEQDPIVKSLADFHVEWPTVANPEGYTDDVFSKVLSRVEELYYNFDA